MVTASGLFVPQAFATRPTCQIELPTLGTPVSVSVNREGGGLTTTKKFVPLIAPACLTLRPKAGTYGLWMKKFELRVIA
jgi:hypothetical protein